MKKRLIKISSYLCVFAVMLNTLLPFYATYQLPTDNASIEELESLFGNRILVCTVDGFNWISIAELQEGEIPQTHEDIQCAMCLTSASGIQFGEHHSDSIFRISLLGVEPFYYHESLSWQEVVARYRLQQPRDPPATFIS